MKHAGGQRDMYRVESQWDGLKWNGGCDAVIKGCMRNGGKL